MQYDDKITQNLFTKYSLDLHSWIIKKPTNKNNNIFKRKVNQLNIYNLNKYL